VDEDRSGDTFANDPSGFAYMLSEILSDAPVIDPEG
jgi:hypothetical protein